MTVTDTAGNPTSVDITFPPVDKGDQNLRNFYYSPPTVTFGDSAPSVTGPSGVLTSLRYSAMPAEVCTINAMSGALSLADVGDCVVTATAADTANYNEATVAFTVIVQSAGTLALNVDAIAGDDTVNIAEHEAGFTISGDTGAEAGVTVSVTIGTQSPQTVTSAANGAWSVPVSANAAYITGTSVTVTVSATKTGFTSPSPETRDLTVDLIAPSVSYTPPATLKVRVSVILDWTSSDSDHDINSASYSATGLPPGLRFLEVGPDIVGRPTTANPDPTTVTVTVTDTAGNPTEVEITFPPVEKGDQNLGNLYYDPSTVTFGDAAPMVTAPLRVLTSLRYSAMPAEVCTVEMATGELTIHGAGTCEITATAVSDGNYNAATRTATVTVESDLSTLALSVAPIAGDDVVNIAEKAAGFTISGNTGTEVGVTVTVMVARGAVLLPTAPATKLTATSVAGGAWSVEVPADAAYIGESSLAVRVSASKAGFASPSEVTRRIAVDLAGPYLIYFDRFINLKVGALATVHLGGTTARSFRATGLPSWLSIDPDSGVISGTPVAVDPDSFTVTVTATDAAGNTAEVTVAFPAVAKGDQDLADFAYTPATLTFGSTTPTVNAPTGVRTTVSYAAMPVGVCTVDDANGALTLAGPGTCTITATAAGTANYNAAMADATVTVLASGTLALTVDPIAGDDTVNIDEKADGFTISGATGSEAGVSVTRHHGRYAAHRRP